MTTITRQKSTGDHVSTGIANATLSLVGILILTLAAALLYPFDPITKLGVRVVNEPKIWESSILVEIDYCKARDWTPTEMRWALVNEITIILPVATASLPPGCHVRQIALPIPRHVTPGDYKLQEELVYEMWIGRRFTYVRQSPTFTIQAGNR